MAVNRQIVTVWMARSADLYQQHWHQQH